MSDYIILILVIGIVSVFALRQFFSGPIPYNGRKCMGRAWKEQFPNSDKSEIREYLECFVDGMALSSKTKLKFHPNDHVLDVYKSIYGGRIRTADSMECETFLENLSVSFSKDLSYIINVWKEEITLGELYRAVKA